MFVVTFVALRYAPRLAMLPGLAVWIAAGCWCAQVEPPIPNQHELKHFADGLNRNVRASVIRIRSLHSSPVEESLPQPWQMEPGAWETSTAPAVQSIDLKLEQVEDYGYDYDVMLPVLGGARVTVQGDPLALRCGDVVELPLRLRTPEIYRDPGAWSYWDDLLNQGIGVLATTKPGKLRVTGQGAAPLRCKLYAAQAWAAERMQAFVHSTVNHRLPANARLTDGDAAMLDAMLFGDRSALSHPLRTGFERTGTFHLFVVSGLHIAVLAGAVFWLLRRLRTPQTIAVATTILLLTGYALLTGFGLPVQRALAMTSVYLIARALDRNVTALNALGAAALAVLVLDPRALTESSFQMTFLVIFAVAGIAAPLIERFIRPWYLATRNLDIIRIDAHIHPRYAQFRVRLRMACKLSGALLHQRLTMLPVWLFRCFYWLCDGLLLGVAAEICMSLPMAVYFHRATLFALPLNLLNIPLVSVLVCLAIVTFCCSLLGAWAAALPAAATALLLHLVRFTVDRTQQATLADVRIPGPVPLCIAIACGAIVFACWALRQRGRLWFLTGFVALALAPLATFWPSPPLLHPNSLEVTAIDVGQGDSLLVVSPEGRTMLVDAGGPVGIAAATTQWDVGEEIVAPYLWSRRIRRLDVVVLTHAHSDHMGGMAAVLHDLRPRELWLSVEPPRSLALAALLQQASALGLVVRHFRAGDSLVWAGVQTSVLAPESAYSNSNTATNNDSLVLRLDYGKASVLLEGDAESPSEAAMLAAGRIAPARLLKVGHHGSKTSTTPDFLTAVAPKDAIISVGAHNTFGHPRGDVLMRLEAAGVKTFRTDRMGAETFLLTPDGRISASSAASNR